MKKRLKLITSFLLISLLVVGSGPPTGIYALTDSGANIEIESAVAAPAFDPPVSYDIDASAASVAKGDYNSDGVLDLILTHESTNAFSCLLGNQDGTFASPLVTSTINYPTSPCPGDFNDDGNLDLAFVSGQTHGLHIHLGNGNGTFQAQSTYTVGTSPGRVVDADVNQDGKLDLIVANYHSDNISVLTGNGDGTFNSHVDIPTGTGPSDIEAEDFDGDGKVDIAVLNNYDGSFSILINNSADYMVSFSMGETYTLESSEPWGGAKDLGSLLASDLVGNDGIDDLVMTVCLKGEFDSYILIYKGIGDGTFQQVYADSAGKQAYDIVLGDFNNDDKPDLAMTNRYYSKVVILCKTDDSWQLFNNYPAGSTPNQIVTGDFNDDGLDDLAVANPNSDAALTILLQSNDGGDDTCIIDDCDTLISDGGFADSDLIEEEEYYCVDNAKQLAHIQEHFDENNECYLNFVQTDDIDLSEDFGEGWTPIGGFEGERIFLGKYRGEGYDIRNMKIYQESSEEIVAALFSNVGETAHIEGINLFVEAISTYLYEEGIDRADEEPNDIYIGGIAGLHLAVRTIEDCSVTFQDNIYANNESGDVVFGGITAVNAGSVLDCKTYTNQNDEEENCIYVSTNGGDAYVGGIAGYNVGNVKHSDHQGTLYVTTEDNERKVYIDEAFTKNVYLGGIVGYADASVFSDNIEIEDCQNNGDIACLNSYGQEESRACAGGIAGYIYQGNDEAISGKVLNEIEQDGNPYVHIKNCANIGENEVYSKAQSGISGGIVGASRFTPGAISVIEDCYNRSKVVSKMTEIYNTKGETTTGGLCIGAASGGIIGATGGIEVRSSYSTAEVYADAYANAMTTKKYVEGYAGGIAGLIWNTDFTQNFYLPTETIGSGVGGEVVPITDQQTDIETLEESMPFKIIKIDDPDGVTSTSAINLKTRSFFDSQTQWQWYSGGGVPDHYYDSEKPWRYITSDGYPVLRGAMYTPPVTPPSGGGGGGGSRTAVTTTPAALNKVDHFAYVVGYPDGEVKPLGTITKEEVAVIFYRLMTEESRKAYSTTSQPFADVSSDRWSNKEIATLYNAKIIQGSSDGKFMPAKPITRAEFAAIAAKFDKLEKTQENKFSDISNHWAKDFINSSAEKGWISGYGDGTFRPDNSILRCEAMKLINEVLDRRVDTAGLNKDSKQWPDNTQDKWYYEIVLEATNTHDYERADKPKSIEKWTKIKADPVW